ncbi:MAG: GNAT family N-acetyltransferase [Chloroflexi bacterium]|nr:GNAT family N-acetyltransferase [Chloroflexota bacterium]
MGAPIPVAQPSGVGRPADLTPDDARWLAWHEACSHALLGREVRDLGDAWLLHDPTDREPFWNRIAGIAWPAEPGAFDRRLTEMLALFAGLDRIPHIWPMPGFDTPSDLTARLLANGFEDHGGGMLMALDAPRADATPHRATAAEAAASDRPDRGGSPADRPDRGGSPTGVRIERLHLLTGDAAIAAARAIAAVLVASFAVEPERRVAIELEAVQGLATEAYHAILVRVDGMPAAVARRTTFAGASYLSSIGTDPGFRGRGLGRLVTSAAVVDARAAGSRWTYLGVFEENAVARSLYESLGFVMIGGVAPDLLLRP